MNLTADRLRQLLIYDANTGVFNWKCGRGAGAVAGSVRPRGWRYVVLDGHSYAAHRLAWLYMTDAWPSQNIDHINCTRDDNRFANLREANARQNAWNKKTASNNKLGFKGVHFYQGKYQANIRLFGVKTYLGAFDSAQAASSAYASAAESHFGEFARGA